MTTDDYQGPAMSIYAYNTLKFTKVGVLDDSTVFGVGIANTFETKFKALGGATLRKGYKKDQTSDFRVILGTFKTFGAQAIYVGGTDDQNICVPRAQMKSIGWTVPFLGGDGIETPDCINEAAGNEAGIYATSAGADATQVPSAASAI
ncbi:MAG: branched-chain amino acid ABC transporter substrate-binding protein, partial [Chloroflexi bacterium]